MKVKSFKLRIDEPYNIEDQNNINEFINKVQIKKSVSQYVQRDIPFWSFVFFYEDKIEDKTSKDKILYPKDTELNEEQKRIYDALRDWRQEVANQLRQPPFFVCHNSELVTFSIIQPRKIEDFEKIKGWNGRKLEKYGEEIISIINAF